jgi:polysaccharide pyruvyl transferase WcaK-like protein
LTRRRTSARGGRSPAAPRVGLFGLLGSGNIGNDASMESILGYLRARHPSAVVDAMCMGPDQLTARYGLPAIPLQWAKQFDGRLGGASSAAARALGKVLDAGRTVRWVRQHDAVIVPGMGVLEASLPLRAWGVPYAMFLLCAGGRLTGTKVALVSVGANNINQRPTRFFFNTAARLAYYRSYRDAQSREAMTARGVNVAADPVYPDLVFGLPVSPDPGDPATVGVGVMTYRGTNDDRGRAGEIYGAYVTTFTRFILWLLDQGRSVRVFVGDKTDDEALAEITGRVRQARPGLEPGRLVAEPPATFSELSRSMAPVSSVIATRYHNVMCSLRLGKPTISLGYARKNWVLMEEMGLGEFCQSANALDLDLLIKQFIELESRTPELRRVIAYRNLANARLLDRQFDQLDVLLFPAARSASPVS